MKSWAVLMSHEQSMRMFPFYDDQHGWGYVIGDFSEVRDPKHAGGSDAICDADANHFGGVSLSSEVGNQIPPLPPVCCDYFKVIFYLCTSLYSPLDSSSMNYL